MKISIKNSTLKVLITSFVFILAGPVTTFAATVASPGTAGNFTVLANAAITCTNGNITGNVGTFMATPTGSVTQTTCPIGGTINVGNVISKQAFNDFIAMYAALTPQPSDVCTTLTGTLSGVTLAPGNYCFVGAAALTGTLTLNGPANGVWNFKVGTGGTGALTTTNFSTVLTGGALASNVTWWVAQAATMTTSNFKGSVLAGAAITMTGGTFNGDAWSKADVTITGTAVTGVVLPNGGGSGGNGGNGGNDCKDKDRGNCKDDNNCKDNNKNNDRGNDKNKYGNDDRDNCDHGLGNGREDCNSDGSSHNSSNDNGGGSYGNSDNNGGNNHW